MSAFESPKIQDYFDQILFIRNKQGRSYDIICPPKSQKTRFFRNFLSLNEVNLKFKEPPWKQHIWCQRLFHQLQIEDKNFHLSRVLFELSDFEDDETGISQKIKYSKFKIFISIFFENNFFGSFLTVS